MTPGTVHLVGAGPGDPELVTVRGLRLLRAADVVVHDRLVHPDLIAEARPDAERVDVGKAPGRPSPSQEEIGRLLVARAFSVGAGRSVVRLKGGDPFVFGRGGEEREACARAGVPCRVVPGVTSAVGVPTSVGIPVTHRGLAASFAVVTAHRAADLDDVDWAALARLDTLVVLMGVARLRYVAANLVRAGKRRETPVAIVERGTWEEERVLETTLAGLAEKAEAAGVRPPAIVVVGEVAALRSSPADRSPHSPSLPLAPRGARETSPPVPVAAGVGWDRIPPSDSLAEVRAGAPFLPAPLRGVLRDDVRGRGRRSDPTTAARQPGRPPRSSGDGDGGPPGSGASGPG